MEESNVIRFPGFKQDCPPQNEEDLKKSLRDVKERFVSEAAVEFAFDVFRNMEKSGCDINSDKKARHDLVLISEAIKSAMYRSVGVHHPLQKFAVDVIEPAESEIDFDDKE